MQKWFDAWGSRGQSFVHKVLVLWCYSSGTEPIASIVGLIPPTTVMFEQKWPKGKGKGKLKNERKTGDLLHKNEDLPDNWRVHAENGQHGYNYRTEVKIANTKVVVLLDGGSGINSVTEEMLIGMLNKCWAEHTPRDSKLCPVIQLEKWPQAEMVMGIAASKPLTLAGPPSFVCIFAT